MIILIILVIVFIILLIFLNYNLKCLIKVLKVSKGDEGKFKSSNNNLTKDRFLDAGLDIYSNEEVTIKPGTSASIKTDLYIEIPEGYVGLLWSRSGLSVKNNIEVGAGCIDCTYRGEIIVKLYNFGHNDFRVEKGMRIAQLLTIPINLNFYTRVEKLSETDRGEKGIGSSGLK